MTLITYVTDEGTAAVLNEGAVPRKGEGVTFPHLIAADGLPERWLVQRVEWTVTIDRGGSFTDAHVFMIRAKDA
jgi:hypothetical protein